MGDKKSLSKILQIYRRDQGEFTPSAYYTLLPKVHSTQILHDQY
uniref:Uncharacterized protein n=1 Tax=Anguilla anguilla TaxID=7936 RepID=A0A0E9W2X8_ANGAN